MTDQTTPARAFGERRIGWWWVGTYTAEDGIERPLPSGLRYWRRVSASREAMTAAVMWSDGLWVAGGHPLQQEDARASQEALCRRGAWRGHVRAVLPDAGDRRLPQPEAIPRARVPVVSADQSTNWRPISDLSPETCKDYLLWNGVRVFVGWQDDEGWIDSTVPEHMAGPEDPQPTHWHPWPEPPAEAP